jgi:hypothetical protein
MQVHVELIAGLAGLGTMMHVTLRKLRSAKASLGGPVLSTDWSWSLLNVGQGDTVEDGVATQRTVQRDPSGPGRPGSLCEVSDPVNVKRLGVVSPSEIRRSHFSSAVSHIRRKPRAASRVWAQ